ncbi:hypothetical protein CNEO2_10024 [Clostridium neonatale]|nr:hypothetical protein CNEO2_10024 [Clostridium neonatale]CAI3541347.1 hypothetical protein CNEO4_10024 [Clostridium neonatale]
MEMENDIQSKRKLVIKDNENQELTNEITNILCQSRIFFEIGVDNYEKNNN